MTYFRLLEDLTPPARRPPDNQLWVSAEIQEAPLASGLWTTIEGPITLSPAVTDPTDPPTYAFSTTNAQFENAWYRIVWTDSVAFAHPSHPFSFVALPPWAPAVADVAALVRSRLKLKGGTRVTNFTEDTIPKASEVQDLVEKASRKVVSKVGFTLTSMDKEQDARQNAALYAAMLVELNYFAEQIDTDRSSYNEMKALWDEWTKDVEEGDIKGDDPTQKGVSFNFAATETVPSDTRGLGKW